MPVFDGDPIVQGDKLFIQNEGTVTVLKLYSNKIMVAVPGKGTRTFSYGGVMSGDSYKTLYWHDPNVVTPRKDPNAWALQRSLLRENMESLSRFITGAHYTYGEDVLVAQDDLPEHVGTELLASAAVPVGK